MSDKLSIAVIGLGLIGGSILKGLKPYNYKLIGVSRRQETIDNAIQEEIISEGGTDLSIIKDADVVFVCTPINKTISMIQAVHKIVKAEAIITDVASIKGSILDFVNDCRESINFIGGHPMAGTENKGLDSSYSDLYQGVKWVLAPSKWTKNEDLKLLSGLIEQLGAEVVKADPKEHDKAVALISHMPLFLSQALFSLVKNYSDKNIGELAMKLAASGFRDMTRLAATNSELSKDMLFENKSAVVECLGEFVDEFAELEIELSDNEEKFVETSEHLMQLRKKMYSPEGKNIVK